MTRRLFSLLLLCLPLACETRLEAFTAFGPDGPGGTPDGLAGLALSAGTLTPAFSRNTTAYRATVSNTTTTVTVTPTATTNATVRVNGSVVASGTPSQPIALAVGDNAINVTVEAPSGTRVYVITVTRAANSPNP